MKVKRRVKNVTAMIVDESGKSTRRIECSCSTVDKAYELAKWIRWMVSVGYSQWDVLDIVVVGSNEYTYRVES